MFHIQGRDIEPLTPSTGPSPGESSRRQKELLKVITRNEASSSAAVSLRNAIEPTTAGLERWCFWCVMNGNKISFLKHGIAAAWRNQPGINI